MVTASSNLVNSPDDARLTNDRGRWNRSCLRCAKALVQEALESACIEVLADVDVAAAVHGDCVRNVERAAEETLLTEPRDHLQRLPLHNPDPVVGAVDHVQ